MPRGSTRRSRSAVKFGAPFKVSVDSLRFDLANPRYASDQPSGRATDAQIISQLLVTADIAELVQSIAANGYIDIEPMVVMPAEHEFIVLEGNRRLAAIRLLSNRNLAAECSFTVPPITERGSCPWEWCRSAVVRS